MADFVMITGDDVCPDIMAPAATTIFHKVLYFKLDSNDRYIEMGSLVLVEDFLVV